MLYRTARRTTLLLALALVAGACSDSTASGLGSVAGQVTAADGTTPIPGAKVALVSGVGPTATTGLDGAYVLDEVPTGAQTLVARRGNFEATIQVVVQAEGRTPAPKLALKSAGKLAYVPGSFDSIERIVRDRLGNAMDELTASQLASAAVTSQYRMIFLNCGMDTFPLADEAAAENLRAWVRAGGTLYVSDLAIDVVQTLFPDAVVESESGDAQSVVADVVSTDLRSFVGAPTVEIQYDLGAWATLEQVAPAATVLLRGDYDRGDGTRATGQPLAIVLREGQGRVVYTTFHNETGATDDQIAVLRYFIYIE